MQFRPDGGDAGFDARRAAAAAAASSFSVPSCSSLMLSLSLSLSLCAGSPSIYLLSVFLSFFLSLGCAMCLQKRCPACCCDRDDFFF
jgi:hypothetical protein